MKKLLLPLFIILFAGTSYAQFSLEKFLNEKVSKPDRITDLNMEEMMKKAVDAKIGGIDVKIVNAKSNNGRIIFKSVTNANLVVAQAKKLNDYLKGKMLKILGKTSNENVVNGVINNMWKKPDGTTYMLTYSGNLVMLVIMNK